MTFDFSPGFLRSLKSYTPEREQQIKNGLKHFMKLYEEGGIPTGFGLTKLRPWLWELRIGLSDRVLFWRERNNVLFDFVGNHEEVRRFLKHL